MVVKFIEIHAILLISCVAVFVDVITATIPVYDQNKCDGVIEIGTASKAGRLIYRYSPGSGRNICNITIQTTDRYQTTGVYYHIAYAFLETDAPNNFKCQSLIYVDNGFMTESYCGSNVYPKYAQTTRSSILQLSVVGDGETEFMFNLLFVSFHNTSCLSHETRCNGLLGDSTAGSACVDYSLVCHEAYIFCEESGSRCGDIVSRSKSNSTLIAVLVPTSVIILLVAVGGFLCYRNKCCVFLKRNGSEEDVRTRAMNIFSLQLTSRGVDGNDNAACTDDEGGPIDFSKFDPPPEYGSLEHLDNVGASETDGSRSPTEVLPSYGDVMKNFDSYSITTQI